MKWQKTPINLLSKKTFLVIREDLRTIKEKDKSQERSLFASPQETVVAAIAESSRLATVATCSDTWPKMRKKRSKKNRSIMYESSDIEEPRPATASLEAPLVLDPRLIDKLDMSIICKESLTESLSRIKLSEPSTKHQESTLAKMRARFASISPTRKLRKKSPDSSESDSRTTSIETARSFDAKRLDDNNNKNKHQQPLSPLRSRSSRSTVCSSDVALFTGGGANFKKKATEPCRACGRAAQPERFHSHPKSPNLSPSSARSNLSVIPVRSTYIKHSAHRKSSARADQQQQIPGGVPDKISSPRNEQIVASLSASTMNLLYETVNSASFDEKMPSDDIARKDRQISSATIPKLNDDKSSAKRRPRTVTCYICGREFGSASFPIHEPKCLEKWHRENKALPSAQRRNEPQRPNVPIDHEDWNTAAWEQSQALLIPCLKCKRTFLPDRLNIHERNCRVSNKVAINGNTSRSSSNNKNAIDLQGSTTITEVSEVRSTEIPRRIPMYQGSLKNGQCLSAKRSSRIAVREKSAY